MKTVFVTSHQTIYFLRYDIKLENPFKETALASDAGLYYKFDVDVATGRPSGCPGFEFEEWQSGTLGIYYLIGISIFQIVQNNHLLRIFYCGA